MSVTDLAEVRRARKARDDGRCQHCAGPRVVCSRMGRPCCYLEEDD